MALPNKLDAIANCAFRECFENPARIRSGDGFRQRSDVRFADDKSEGAEAPHRVDISEGKGCGRSENHEPFCARKNAELSGAQNCFLDLRPDNRFQAVAAAKVDANS